MLPTGMMVVALVAVQDSRPFIDRVPQLKATADLAARGAMGCGAGEIQVETSRGVVKVMTSLDPIHVFGGAVKATDLLTLVKSRADSNCSGKPGPMSGEVGRLCCLSMSVLSSSGEPDAMSLLIELLTDEDAVIRGGAVICLFRLGDANKDVRAAIREVRFPDAAMKSAGTAGKQPPEWLVSDK